MVDLAATVDAGGDAMHFANDVAVTDNGMAYVTDTQMNVIYRVDADHAASVFHSFEDGGAGPNGIGHHPGAIFWWRAGPRCGRCRSTIRRLRRKWRCRRRCRGRTAWSGPPAA